MEENNTNLNEVSEKSLWTYFKEVFTKNYLNFNGRARRKEFWGFVLFNILISWGIAIIASLTTSRFQYMVYHPIYILWVLATFIPNLALQVRRLHDTGKSGIHLLMLIIVIPFVFAIIGVVLIFFVLAATSSNSDVSVLFSGSLSGILYSIACLAYFVYAIYLFVYIGFIDSQKGTNKYGENPKGIN